MRNIVRHKNPSGFTLVELLIVLGIITILIAILLPVLAKVQQAARDADAKMLVANLKAAIDNYGMDNGGSYPGPFTTDAIGTANCPAKTGSENLTLGIAGGLNQAGAYVPSMVGMGAWNVDHPGKCYIPDAKTGSTLLSVGQFTDDMGNASTDGPIPEFLDNYAVRLPILYLRARDLPGVVGLNGAPRCAYDLREVLPYTSSKIGGVKAHGLQDIGVAGNVSDILPAGGANAYMYLKDPNSQSMSNATDTPRQKKGYILISAGTDRIYGTIDDITSFGGLKE